MSSPEINALGRALQIVGDHRNLAIIRGAFLGSQRFGDFQSSLDIPPAALSGRLATLVDDGIFKRVPYSTAPLRHQYRMTDTGKALWPMFVALWTWEARWNPRTPSGRATLRHEHCNHLTRPLLGCNSCRAVAVTAQDTTANFDDPFAGANPPRRYRRALRSEDEETTTAIDLLGDRWSTSILSSAFLGAHRFKDFQNLILAIPARMLADRLDFFVQQQVLIRDPTKDGAKRMEYRLAPKGFDFFAVFATLVHWTNNSLAPNEEPPILIIHRECGQTYQPNWICNICNESLDRPAIHFRFR